MLHTFHQLRHGPLVLMALIALQLPGGFVAAADFLPQQSITDADQKYQLSRNPGGMLAIDAAGRAHLAYWAGGFVTTPSTPSAILHRHFTIAAGWSAQAQVDASTIDLGSGPQPFGGRHPAMILDPGGNAVVAWHDHRHSDPDPPGNSIDNVEIYLNRRPAAGAFAAADERMTTTAAANGGDNGYMPRLAISPTGVIALAWYDFHFDGETSDIFVRVSDAAGAFPAGTMADWRRTDATTRPGVGQGYSLPDIAFDSTGTLHAVWTRDYTAVGPILYASFDPATPGLVSEIELATDTGAFFDPAKVIVDADDTVWVVYTSTASGESDVRVLRRLAGAPSFDAPVAIKALAGVVEKAPTLAVDGDGKLHLAWTNEASGQRHVHYGLFDYDSTTLEQEVVLTSAAGAWERPCVALDPDGRPWVVWEQNVSFAVGQLWMARPAPPTTVDDWRVYTRSGSEP